MQKKNVKLIKKFKLFNNIYILKAKIELNNKKFYIIKENVYKYKKNKKNKNYKKKKDYIKYKKRKKKEKSKKYSSLYKKKLKCF